MAAHLRSAVFLTIPAIMDKLIILHRAALERLPRRLVFSGMMLNNREPLAPASAAYNEHAHVAIRRFLRARFVSLIVVFPDPGRVVFVFFCRRNRNN